MTFDRPVDDQRALAKAIAVERHDQAHQYKVENFRRRYQYVTRDAPTAFELKYRSDLVRNEAYARRALAEGKTHVEIVKTIADDMRGRHPDPDSYGQMVLDRAVRQSLRLDREDLRTH
jgi:hypothetical protein